MKKDLNSVRPSGTEKNKPQVIGGVPYELHLSNSPQIQSDNMTAKDATGEEETLVLAQSVNPLKTAVMKGIDSKESDAIVQDALGSIPKENTKWASFFDVQRMNQFVDDGKRMPEPQEFIPHVVVEEETTMMFGETGIGKSTLAIQYAIEIAKTGKTVMYVNFELSQQQIAKKFEDYILPESLYIANIDYTKMHDVTEQNMMLGEIEKIALGYETKVLIIDNMTNLCINSKEGSEAGKIMLQLMSLKKTHQWTMLILAHVPKRKASDPLSINDLAGSKIISNLADNVIGLNKSKNGSNIRYMIQLKYRSRPIELDCKNVQEMTLGMFDGYVHFKMGGYSEERTHLPRSRDEKAELERDIIHELKEPNGLSYREIADKLATSLGMVQRVAKQYGLNRKSDKK